MLRIALISVLPHVSFTNFPFPFVSSVGRVQWGGLPECFPPTTASL